MTKKEKEDEAILLARQERWGATHEITKVYGTRVELKDLPEGVSVCAGDMKTYDFQLKEKK